MILTGNEVILKSNKMKRGAIYELKVLKLEFCLDNVSVYYKYYIKNDFWEEYFHKKLVWEESLTKKIDLGKNLSPKK